MKKYPFELSGSLLIFAGVAVLMGIVTSEMYFRGYSTRENIISNLGQTTDPVNNSHSSSWIFNIALVCAGTATIVAAYCFRDATHNNIVSLPLLIHGIGTIGVGVFNSNFKGIHFAFALITFLSIEFAAVASFSFAVSPGKYLFGLMGIISFLALVLNPLLTRTMGEGGAERWIVYPTTIWLIAFGAYLLGLRASG